MKTIGQVLRDARIAGKISQRKLAIMLDVSQTYLSDVERGHRPLAAERRALLPPEIQEAVLAAMEAELLRQIDEIRQQRAQLAPPRRRARQEGGQE